LHINEKRLKDVDEIIDDPELDKAISDEEWEFITKERFIDEE
jgi:hypothetical protein